MKITLIILTVIATVCFAWAAHPDREHAWIGVVIGNESKPAEDRSAIMEADGPEKVFRALEAGGSFSGDNLFMIRARRWESIDRILSYVNSKRIVMHNEGISTAILLYFSGSGSRSQLQFGDTAVTVESVWKKIVGDSAYSGVIILDLASPTGDAQGESPEFFFSFKSDLSVLEMGGISSRQTTSMASAETNLGDILSFGILGGADYDNDGNVTIEEIAQHISKNHWAAKKMRLPQRSSLNASNLRLFQSMVAYTNRSEGVRFESGLDKSRLRIVDVNRSRLLGDVTITQTPTILKLFPGVYEIVDLTAERSPRVALVHIQTGKITPVSSADFRTSSRPGAAQKGFYAVGTDSFSIVTPKEPENYLPRLLRKPIQPHFGVGWEIGSYKYEGAAGVFLSLMPIRHLEATFGALIGDNTIFTPSLFSPYDSSSISSTGNRYAGYLDLQLSLPRVVTMGSAGIDVKFGVGFSHELAKGQSTIEYFGTDPNFSYTKGSTRNYRETVQDIRLPLTLAYQLKKLPFDFFMQLCWTYGLESSDTRAGFTFGSRYLF